QEVLGNLNRYIIVDIRDSIAYQAGHINGAYNVNKKDILNFLTKKRKASSAEKVVIVCYTGQLASYVTGITRFAGFDNTYVLLYGMAGWNSEFLGPLKKAFGDAKNNFIAVNKVVDKKNEGEHHAEVEEFKNEKIDYSIFPTPGKGSITDIVRKRAEELLSLKRPEFLVKANEFFDNLKKDPNYYYTIAYMKKNQFDFAHVKNAHQFTPRKDISPYYKLKDIPKDKPVTIYCKSGHTAGNVNAMLKMLGYDSHSILLGVSSFMHKIWADQGWQVKDINALTNDYPLTRGKNRTSKNPFIAKTTKEASAAPMPMVKRKKKEVSGGCG
ncbi:MAG TPA: hypothetical protein ENK75_02215, partial [Saprospiraceae bacterium]|nr:hypothetical protein [Saprospiraceae bacterium]